MWKWETENEPKGVVVIVHDLLEHHYCRVSILFVISVD